VISIVKRIIAKGKRFLIICGLPGGYRQVQHFKSENKHSRKLLIVGPGSVSVPPKGWGAVETIISETIPVYQDSGFEVFLVNSKHILDFIKGKQFQPDVILLHEDTAIRRLRFLFPNTTIVMITHYGLAAFPELWSSSYKRAFKNFKYADYVVCLSPAILKTFKRFFPENQLLFCPNGTCFENSGHGLHNRGLIYLGKIEPRKKQFELYKYFKDMNVAVTFVGEIQDERVASLIKRDSIAASEFVGAWTRSSVIQNLPHYSGLLLLSAGEADALVLYEAQIAGLPIIVSSSAAGSQDLSLPWIHVHSFDRPAQEILDFLEKMSLAGHEIASFAQKNYRWEHRIGSLINVLLSGEGANGKNHN